MVLFFGMVVYLMAASCEGVNKKYKQQLVH